MSSQALSNTMPGAPGSEAQRRGRCPRCGSGEVVHLLAGMPTEPPSPDIVPPWVRMIGCSPKPWDRCCEDCKHTWRGADVVFSQLLTTDLWETCRNYAALSTRTRAAVAYVSKDAADLFPLKQGDIAVVDASPAALRAGTTSPEGIASWLDQGVDVYSLDGLHAKTFRFSGADEVTVVGSGNVSLSSRDRLVEAAVLSDSPQLASETDDFINLCIAQAMPLSHAWLGLLHG